MKAALITIVIVLSLILVGWITLDTSEDRASVNIETQEIKADTEKAVEKGKDLINEAKQEIQNEKDSPND